MSTFWWITLIKTPKNVDTLSSELSLKQRQFDTNVKINLIITFVTKCNDCNKCNDDWGDRFGPFGCLFWRSYAGGVRLKVHGEECAAESPAGSRGRAAEGGQRKPHEAVGFLALGWNWFHWLSENVTRYATRTSVFAGTTLRGGGYPNIFSSILRKSREWPRRTVGGGRVKPPKPPWRRHCEYTG